MAQLSTILGQLANFDYDISVQAIGIYDIIGLLGVAFLVSAYAMLQWRRDFSKTFQYSAMNLTSATCLGISVFHHWNLASFVCNVFWGLISLYGLYRWAKYDYRNRRLAAKAN